jgi:outer membrane protein assembly factor BamB
MPDFDPATVPPFPVVTLDLLDDSTVTVNGRSVDIGPDEPPTEAGIAAVAHVVKDQGLDAVRVRATSPDGTHLMVVTATGVAYDITPAEKSSASRPRGRRLIVGGVTVLAMLLAVGGVVGVVSANKPEPVVTAETPGKPPGYLANLPVLAPPGYAQKAAWALPVQPRSEPVLLDDGRVVIVDDEGNLTIVNSSTGAVTWQGSGGPTGQSGIHATTVENRPVLAAASSTELTLWPLDVADTAKVAGTPVDLGASGEVSYLGSAPLVTLSDQTVALLTEDGVKRVDVPVTSTAILATQSAVIAANAESWWVVPATGEPSRSHLPRPFGITDGPVLISAADDSHLIVVWPTDDDTDVVTLVDLDANEIVAKATVPSGAIRDDTAPARSPSDTTMTLGNTYLDYGPHPQVITLGDVVAAVVDNRSVYGTRDREPVVARFDGTAFTVTPFTTLTTDDTALPAAVTPDHAYVVAEKVDTTLLYALPRIYEGDNQ